MTAEDRAARLTAFALNDPSLTAADRVEIETTLAADPAARAEVEETKQLAGLLTAGLAAELAAQPAELPITLATAKSARKSGPWVAYAVAASVVLAVCGGVYLATDVQKVREYSERAAAEHKRRAAEHEVAQMDALRPTEGTDGRRSEDLERLSPTDTQAQAVREIGGRGDEASRRKLTTGVAPLTEDSPALPGPGGPGMRLPRGKASSAGASAPGSGTPGGGPGAAIGGPTAGPPANPLPRPAKPGESDRYSTQPGDGKGEYRELPPETPALPQPADPHYETPSANDRYRQLIENRFTAVEGQAALSTFGVDVDTASYAIVRKYLTMGQLPPANAVRLEELVNYFPYADKAPDGDNPFAVTVELAECPWAPKHRLARIGLKAKPIATDKRPPSNLVFLIDVSGSMNAPNRLPLVKQSLRLLVNELGENDHVAMVVYAGTTGLVLDSTSATKKDVILGALDRLEAGGSTNGSGGLQQAYAVAVANFKKGGTNRVVLCTDGDWNVGTTSTTELVKMVEEKRKTGVFLSVFGFGMGNLRDEMMVQLAGKGNGNYAYIDTIKEAHKALVEQLGGTLVTVAKDVKIQVEFNPAKVSAYRLLGYEKRALAAKDFADDTKDAGEMGAGHVVTALYELVPAGAGAKVDGLRYQPGEPKPRNSKESFVVKMRHKKPDGDVSTLRELPVTDPGKGYAEASEDFRFAASVAAFAMLLRDSPFKGEASFALVQELAAAATKHDPSGYRAEFVELVKRAKAISGKQ